jgi:hypothetical protein
MNKGLPLYAAKINDIELALKLQTFSPNLKLNIMTDFHRFFLGIKLTLKMVLVFVETVLGGSALTK